MISVCIATHNGEKFIKEQLDSILSQLAPEDEVVISDDGSTDKTLYIIAEYNDPRLKVLHFNQPSKTRYTHLYVTRNFENALKHTQGDIIFLSDQDDKWMPDKVKKCVAAISNMGLVVHNLRIVNDNMEDSGENLYKNGFVRFRNYFLRVGKYYGCSLAFRREMMDVIMPFPSKLVLHDYWIGILAEHFGGAVYIDEPLIYYRVRDASISHGAAYPIIYKIWYRVYILCHLYCRLLSVHLYNWISLLK